MKKILFILLVFISYQSFGQGGWIRPNNSHGTLSKGVGGDSAVYIPTGNGAPSGAINLYTAPMRKSGIYFDSTNNRLYYFNPKDSTWSYTSTGSGSANTSLGTGYAVAVTGTNNVKSLTPGWGTLFDSTATEVNVEVDSTTLKDVFWARRGNGGTDSEYDFLGTTDNVNLRFRRGGIKSGLIDSTNRNTSFGFLSFNSLTTGYSNTGIGFKSLATNTEGHANVALGVLSLSLNTTGNENTAIGYNALNSQISAPNNVAVGSASLSSNLYGGNNVGIGYTSLYNNLSDRNTAIGTSTLYENSSGYNNIALGFTAGKNNSTENYRIYLNSIDRITKQGDTTESPYYAVQDAVAANQRTYINSKLYAPYLSTGIPAGAKRLLIGSDNQFYADDTASTGGVSQTWQQTLTTGSTLTGNNTIAGGDYNFTFGGMGITTISQTAKASVGGSNGTAHVSPLTVTGGAGGATSYSTGTVLGGNAGAINVTGGNGGAITGTPTTGVGGTGGNITVLAGDGGLGTTNGGVGGYVEVQGGTGGGGTAGGTAGYAALKGGNAGSTGNAQGGNIYVVPGIGNGSGSSGHIFMGLSPSATVRGSTTFGSATAGDSLVNIKDGGLFAERGVRFSGLPTAVGLYSVRADAAGNLSLADTTSGGGSSGITVGTTTITSGTSGRVGYNNAGVYGEYPITGTGNVAMSASPTFTGTIGAANITATGTITGRWAARVGSTTSSATPTINTDDYDIYKLTAQTADITSFTTNLSGTPVDGDILEIQITGTAARAITWGSSFVSSTVTLPATTVTTATLTVILQWYSTSSYGNSKWHCVNYY